MYSIYQTPQRALLAISPLSLRRWVRYDERKLRGWNSLGCDRTYRSRASCSTLHPDRGFCTGQPLHLKYSAQTRADLKSFYSQHAAAFLLTLLPNVLDITLPESWKRQPTTIKLIDTIICTANQSKLTSSISNV